MNDKITLPATTPKTGLAAIWYDNPLMAWIRGKFGLAGGGVVLAIIVTIIVLAILIVKLKTAGKK